MAITSDSLMRFSSVTQKIYNVLFLCTGNSARSVMSEALITVHGKGRFKGFSAGSYPTGKVNPFAIELTNSIGYPENHLRSKSWDEFALPGAPPMDIIITVCDNAAGEVCPVWPGHPISAHWGFPDPAAVEGNDEQKRQAFKTIFRQIADRVNLLLALPIDEIDRISLQTRIKAIGQP
jgi:arsenate reductase